MLFLVMHSEVRIMLLITILIVFLSPFTAFSVTAASLPKITSFQIHYIGYLPTRRRLTLKCTASGEPSPSVEFQYNNILLNESSNPRVLFNNPNEIKIINVSADQDNGVYRCVARNSYGWTFKTKEFKLPVKGNFVPGSRLSDRIRVREVTLGLPVELTCPRHTDIYPLKYRWGSNNIREGWLTDNRNRIQYDRALFFKMVTQDVVDFIKTVGGISCVIISDGHVYTSVRYILKVVGVNKKPISPKILIPLPSIVTIKEGESSTLTCIAYGNPLPEISWFRNGVAITRNDSKYGISPYVTEKLTINNMDKSLAGKFKCEAKNSNGKQESNVYVSVAIPPTINKSRNYFDVPNNGSLKLECLATGTGKLVYEWYRNGSLLSSYQTKTIKMIIKDGVLTINRVAPDDSGSYQCYVYNKYGGDTNVATVRVTESSIKEIDGQADKNSSIPNGGSKKETFKMQYIIIIACGGVVFLIIMGGGCFMYYRTKNNNKRYRAKIPTPHQDVLKPLQYSETFPHRPYSLIDDYNYGKDSSHGERNLSHVEVIDRLAEQRTPNNKNNEHVYHAISEEFIRRKSLQPSTEL